MPKKLSALEFKERAEKVHGSRYDYAGVVYTSTHVKVDIRCVIHGIFKQSPFSHLKGSGCPLCSNNNLPLTTDSFVAKAREKHGDRYDYSLISEYTNNRTKVKIVCDNHGTFEQSVFAHLSGNGCPNCGGKLVLGKETFIERARQIHGDKYDYSHIEYKSNKALIEIICPKHGKFRQRPMNHLEGKGCKFCISRVSKTCSAWLDSLNIPNDAEHREVKLSVVGRRFFVDGYDPKTNTIYEFLGDFWHGNPARFSPDHMHPITKKTMGQVWQETQDRLDYLRSVGYVLVCIWESEWRVPDA